MAPKIVSQEVEDLFEGKILTGNNIKSLKKERKINDTIVATISFIIILLSFFQLDTLIQTNYEETSIILTMRTCILLLSIPNRLCIISHLPLSALHDPHRDP